MMGDFLHQVDLHDYKAFDDLAIATRVEYSVPNIRWTRAVTSVQHNEAMDAKLFSP